MNRSRHFRLHHFTAMFVAVLLLTLATQMSQAFDAAAWLERPVPEKKAPYDQQQFAEIVNWIRNSAEPGQGYAVLKHYLALHEDEADGSITYTTGYLGFLEGNSRAQNLESLGMMVSTLGSAADHDTRQDRLSTCIDFALAIGDATQVRELGKMAMDSAEGREEAKRAKRFVAVAQLLGATAPEFRRQSTGGKLVDLAKLRGKPVVLDFWASWCAPCKDEFPYLKKIAHTMEGAIHVVGISLDDEPDAMAKAIRENGLDYPQIWFPGGLDSLPGKKWQVPYLPWIVLIDSEGRLAHAGLSGQLLLREVERMTGRTIPDGEDIFGKE